MMIRASFVRAQPVCYISHLELINTLRRSLRRTELPVAYSQGFNPQQKLALGQPLPVGMTGEGYFDLELGETLDLREVVEQINRQLPRGIRLAEASVVPPTAASLMAVINTAVYLIKMEFNQLRSTEEQLIKSFLAEQQLEIRRERKNKEDRIINIRPLIQGIEVIRPAVWRLILDTGSRSNLRPEEVLRALGNYCDQSKEVPIINIHREKLLVRIDDKYYKPLAGKVVGSG